MAGTHFPATDYSMNGSGFEQLAPKASTVTLAPASHFTALLTCKPAGKFILEDEIDDPVCTDPVGTDRAGIHQKVIMIIANSFNL